MTTGPPPQEEKRRIDDTMDEDEEDALRRKGELEALRAFYGEDDFQVVVAADGVVGGVGGGANSSSGGGGVAAAWNGPWRIRVGKRATLTLELPRGYPSRTPPTAVLDAPAVSDVRLDRLHRELVEEIWDPDVYGETGVAIAWAEHCRVDLDDEGEEEEDSEGEGQEIHEEVEADAGNGDGIVEKREEDPGGDGVVSFLPSTSRYGQPVRRFRASVVNDAARNGREIYRGPPYHPPKSGPSERMVAHVAAVSSRDHVDWVWAELLLNDANSSKVAKAAHNMVAYRYYDSERDCWVADNDDDGEKGAGSKLAALLEMSDARNVMVVVSRWFGGTLLGPSRFKYIAQVARDALEASGHLDNSNNPNNFGNAGDADCNNSGSTNTEPSGSKRNKGRGKSGRKG